jgi:FkbM family methyltransferase
MLRRIIDTEGFNAVVRGRHGYVLYNKNDVYIGKSIEKYGEFSELEIELFAGICREGDFVIDVGANIGTHTMALAQLVGTNGRVYAFEPQRIVFQALCANMALNSIKNVECFQAAASSEDGFVAIPDFQYEVEDNYGGVAVDKFDAGVEVPTFKLDNFADLPGIRMIKIDVEGMESRVISGAIELINRHKPVLYVENDRLDQSQILIELITSLGYRLYWHLPPLFNADNFAGSRENIFPGIISANMLCIHGSSIDVTTELEPVSNFGYHPLK